MRAMKGLPTAVFLLVVVAVTAMAKKDNHWGTENERSQAISEAISEAKLSAQLKDEAAKAKAASRKDKAFTSFDFLSRAFKKPSEKAIKQGKARLLLEDMVKRAEKKLLEIKRKSSVGKTTMEKAEELAEELFHKPGTLLTAEERAKLLMETDCRTVSTARIRCRLRPNVDVFRTITGECNNLRNPRQGSAGTEFRRLIPAVYEDGISTPLGRLQAQSGPEPGEEANQLMRAGPFMPPKPSARLISKSVVRDRPNPTETNLTHIVMQWGQFLDHDLDLGPELEEECEGCEFTEVCEPIFVAKDDQSFGIGTPRNGSCLPFRRSIAACPTDTPGSFSPREQLNDLTSYIDASMVYGSSVRVANAVRLGRQGLLRTGPEFPAGQATLPVDTQNIVACPDRMDCFLCGDIRCNEQISLTIMHTIWVREHNRLAKALAQLNPSWDDERLYQEARKIVGALVQKITYQDYLPLVMGRAVFDKLIGPFRRYDRTVDASVPNSFATAAYRYGHSLIRPAFDRLNSAYQPISAGPLNLRDAFFNPPQFRASGGAAPILRGLVNVESRRVDEFLNQVLTTQLFEVERGLGMDLAALNIQRSREHGLPGYTIWRNFCQRVFNITSDLENQLTFIRLLRFYGSLDNAELWVGGLAEDRLLDSRLGATFACIFGLTFRNVRDGDRFFYERPRVFTSQQLRQIQRVTLSRVICDNSLVNSIQPNAFVSNQTRVSCSQIPAMSLAPWRENACYMRVTTPVSSLEIFLAARLQGGKFLISSNGDNRRCIPFTCPVTTSLVVVYPPSSFRQTGCRATRASGLPASTSTYASVYAATIGTTQINNVNLGLYRDLASCRQGSTSAVTFSSGCTPTQTQSNGDSDNPTSPNTEKDAPEDVQTGTEMSFDEETTQEEKVKELHNSFDDTKKLRSELAEDLEQLGHK